ncbi:MAG TPA: glycosyltransferase [Dermatophilaceae bacterium]
MASDSGPARIVLVGPASPAALATAFTGRTRAAAEQVSGLGGVPVNSLALGLLKAGRQVEVVTLAPDVSEPVAFDSSSLRVLVAPYRSRARARAADGYRAERRHVAALLKRTEGELLHANWTYEFALPCESDSRPVVVTAHDAPLTVLRRMPSAYRALRTVVAYRARFGIRSLSAVSPYLASRWRREMLWRGPISVIPNIVDGFPQRAVATSDARTGSVVLDLADGTRLKNVTRLLEAFASVRTHLPDAELRLVGRGLGPLGETAAQAKSLGWSHGVSFLGPVSRPAVVQHLHEADVLVHPATEESFALAVAEAMTCGVPVIAGRRSGAVGWTLGNGEAGLLVDITDADAIARAVLRVLGDPELAGRLGAAGARRARTAFSSDVVTAAYLSWYEAAMLRHVAA